VICPLGCLVVACNAAEAGSVPCLVCPARGAAYRPDAGANWVCQGCTLITAATQLPAGHSCRWCGGRRWGQLIAPAPKSKTGNWYGEYRT
jgi:hypothetical protein